MFRIGISCILEIRLSILGYSVLFLLTLLFRKLLASWYELELFISLDVSLSRLKRPGSFDILSESRCIVVCCIVSVIGIWPSLEAGSHCGWL